MIKSQAQYNISVTFLKEGKRFIAYSPLLDLSTSGKTYEEAKQRFSEAVRIFLKELARKDTLEEVLGDLGWQKINRKWIPPVFIGHESHSVRVPLSA